MAPHAAVANGPHPSSARKRRFLLRPIPLALLLLLLLPVLLLLGTLGFDSLRERLRRTRFDSAAWKASLHKPGDPIRLRMVDDLLRRHALKGMTRDEIDAFLGKPPSTGYFGNWDLAYWLGPERGPFSVDSEWLVLRFDRDGRVAECRIVRD